MYVILTYDAKAQRDHKLLKVCRKYLTHEQKSVFEGMLTERELRKLKKELEKVINIEEDSVNIYRFSSLKFSSKEKIGVNAVSVHIL